MKTKLTFIMILLVAVTMQAATLRVSATGNNSGGTSWPNAYTTIQQALAAAASGDEIWVKQDTYTITDELNQLNFKEGVNVYGGFVGTESTLSQRSTDNALTIIKQPSAPATNFRLLQSIALNTAATWDGFTFDGNNVGSGVFLSSNCNLNNVTVKNCLAASGSGAGIFITSSSTFAPVNLTNSTIKDNKLTIDGTVSYFGGGAGIYVGTGSTAALIENCIISGNTINTTAVGSSSVFGAGVYIVEGIIKNCTIDNNNITGIGNDNITGAGIAIVPATLERKVLVTGCTITNNTSLGRGGAILIDPRYSGQYRGNFTIANTKIINNKSSNVGGGIFSTAATVQTTGLGWKLYVINCVIANNEATVGAGMNINSSGFVNITYSTFANNKATSTFGGGAIAFQPSTSQTTAATIKNTLLWGNTSGDISGRSQFSNNSQASTISNCAIQNYDITYFAWVNTTRDAIINLNANNSNTAGPKFLSPTVTTGFGTTNLSAEGWQITVGSPCIGAGIYASDNNGAPIVKDFAGKARPTAADFIYPDIGAYQFDAANPPTLGVKAVISQNSELKIYPTITNSVLNISTNKTIKQMEIFNTNGASVLNNIDAEVINVSVLATGVYLLRVTFDDNNTEVKRFIKQ